MMLVFKSLDDVVEIFHTETGKQVNVQELQQTANQGKYHWKETKGLFTKLCILVIQRCSYDGMISAYNSGERSTYLLKEKAKNWS